jgi:hypothetical protein
MLSRSMKMQALPMYLLLLLAASLIPHGEGSFPNSESPVVGQPPLPEPSVDIDGIKSCVVDVIVDAACDSYNLVISSPFQLPNEVNPLLTFVD